MKNILLALSLFAPVAVVAQTVPAAPTQAGTQAIATPIKRANVIIITTTDSAHVAWQTIGRVLASQGFAIKSSDKDLLTVSTEPVAVGEGGQVAVNAFVRGNTIELRGNMAVPMLGTGVMPMEYRGMAGSTFMRSWRKVDSAAKAYPGGAVTYIRKD